MDSSEDVPDNFDSGSQSPEQDSEDDKPDHVKRERGHETARDSDTNEAGLPSKDFRRATKDMFSVGSALSGGNLLGLNPSGQILRGFNFNPIQEAIKSFAATSGQFVGLNKYFEDTLRATNYFSDVLGAARAASTSLAAAQALSYPRLSDAGDERRTAYSPEMNSSTTYFEQWESVVDNFDEFHEASTSIMAKNPGFTFLWRGQRNATWPLHSQLFRVLWNSKNVWNPDRPHRITENFPTELDMVKAEHAILQHVRSNWRFEETSALVIFARLQHFGAPTRLLDASRNPLIAAWFATESDEADNEEDCRIFALATATAARDDAERTKQEASSRVGHMDATQHDPFWHLLDTDDARSDSEWGTGRLRRYWIPPLYESRISAQNAAFVLDGVPIDSPDFDTYFKKPGGADSWRIADRLASSSIGIRLSKPSAPVGPRISKALPPSFTLRVTAKAKREIRHVLESRYAYTRSTIYPDIQGAAQAISEEIGDLLENL